MSRAVCLFCREPIVTRTFYGQGGTKWIHEDGCMECRPTYASPNFSAARSDA
jgi:hypothetical protein